MENIENEIWKDVIGYEGLYQISNFGRVKSLGNNAARKEKILRQRKIKGYLYVALYKERKMKNCKVHRLVAIAFIPNPLNLPMINHIDENKENNAVDNLEWCDAKYNCNYGTCQKRRVENIDYKARTSNTDYKAIGKKNAEKLTNGVLSKQVYQYTLDGKLVSIWTSVNECGRNGFNKGHISACCRGERKYHKGFIWSYVPLERI